MDIYQKLKAMGLELPQPPAAGGIYTPVLPFAGKLCYMSGCGPAAELWDKRGKLGCELTIEEGQQAARAAALNLLSVLHRDLGDLNRIKRWVKVLGFVAGTADFYDQPAVMNGASALICELFGDERGKPARSAIGAPSLPGNIAVEIEALIELMP